MSAEELNLIENTQPALQHQKIFQVHTHLAYKFISMSLASRTTNKLDNFGILILIFFL